MKNVVKPVNDQIFPASSEEKEELKEVERQKDFLLKKDWEEIADKQQMNNSIKQNILHNLSLIQRNSRNERFDWANVFERQFIRREWIPNQHKKRDEDETWNES